MIKTGTSVTQLIAPCGINCSICIGFLRDKNKCAGCRGTITEKRKYCLVCRIRNCEHFSKTGTKFCYDCEKYPCARLRQLDKRYRTKYNMSIIDNLRLIKDIGVDNFVQLEKIKWNCMDCGGTICVHRGYCIDCGKTKMQEK